MLSLVENGRSGVKFPTATTTDNGQIFIRKVHIFERENLKKNAKNNTHKSENQTDSFEKWKKTERDGEITLFVEYLL